MLIENKNKKILMIVGVLFICICVGIALGYFVFQISGGATSKTIIQLDDKGIGIDYITNLASTDTINLVTDEAGNIRYIGADPDNYVSFNDELWRIIGVFDVDDGTGNIEKRIKLTRSSTIKSSTIILLSWDCKQSGVGSKILSLGDGSNDWTDSQLMMYLNTSVGYNIPTGYTKNNGIVYDSNGNIIYQEGCKPSETMAGTKSYDCTSSSFSLTSTAQSLIDDAVWYLGGIGGSFRDITTTMFYEAERGTKVYPGHATTWTGKIALMYPSDYGYATSGGSTTDRKTCLEYNLDDWEDYKDCYKNNWLFAYGIYLLTPYAEFDNAVFGYSEGVSLISICGNSEVRPTVYLKSNVKLSGEGTKDSPYMISLT